MRTELSQVDPERAAKLHPADKKRIVRAMEVFLLTGRTITEHDRESAGRAPRYDAAYIILDYEDRARLYARIDARVDEMAAQGLFEEAGRVFSGPVSSTARQAIGYKEATMALAGLISREEAVELIKRESRRYAQSASSPGCAGGRARSGYAGARSRTSPPPRAIRQPFSPPTV